ncbi:MAG: hypothetical protein AB7D39_02405 [Pseudodesulfovibrio sp.]|uniref:hypothetical protein n=1 Tax=Pseudodesulfovibrio sp. TaxID=2035812 RepID=UPI003D0DD396
MAEEIVIENRNRPALIILCVFGLILAGGLSLSMFYAFADRFPSVPSLEELSVSAVALASSLALLWSLYTLIRNPAYLKTEAEGIVFGGRVRCYCTWDNVKDIHLLPTEKYSSWGLIGMFYSVVIDLHSSDELFFDNILDRMVSRKAIMGNRLNLPLRNVTSLSPDQVCAGLRERWKRACPASNAVDSMPVVEMANDEPPDEIIVVRNYGALKWFNIACIMLMAAMAKTALTDDGGPDWFKLFVALVVTGGLIWKLVLMLSGKPLLETTLNGITFCGQGGQCHVPWKNIKGISFVPMRWQNYRKSNPKYPDKRVRIEFHNSRDVHYKNLIHRIVGELRGPHYTFNPIGGETNVSMDLVEALQARLDRSRSEVAPDIDSGAEI